MYTLKQLIGVYSMVNLDDSVTAEDLNRLVQKTNEIVKEGRAKIAARNKAHLVEGAQVRMSTKNGGSELGTLIKLKRTRAIVSVNGVNWDTPISSLTPLDEI